MKITGFNTQKKEFYLTVSIDELENLLGKSFYCTTDIEKVIGSEIKNVIQVFNQNKSAINDLNYHKRRILELIGSIENDIKKISFLIPENLESLK